ncbi:DUF4262 domain-containing protein [Lysobacter sp. HA18]
MNEYERNLLQHIEQHGCSVTSVFDPDASDPPFSYSIGIAKSEGASEFIVVGLNSELGHSLINLCNSRAREGERFVSGVPYLGFLEGFPVQFVPVAREHRQAMMLSAFWLHGGPDFAALQLVWPSKTGAWPWDPEATDWLKENQPVLSEAPGHAP